MLSSLAYDGLMGLAGRGGSHVGGSGVPPVLAHGAAVKFYLEADTIVGEIDGVSISSASKWVDGSVNQLGAMQSIMLCPYREDGGNGRPAVQFNGSSSYARSPSFTQAQPLRIFIIGERLSTATCRFFDGNTINRSALQGGFTGGQTKLGLYAGSGDPNWVAHGMGYPMLMDCIFNGASSSFQVNLDGPVSPYTPGSTGFNDGLILGATGALTGGFFLNGRIQAVVVCDASALSVSDANAIRSYLTEKYALTKHNLLACDGNSLTAGNGSSAPAFTYPRQLRALLGGANVWRTYNFGVPSQTTQQMAADAATEVDPKNTGFQKSVLIAFEIGNDIKLNDLTGAQAHTNFQGYCQARQSAGWGGTATSKIVVMTAPVRADLDATEAGALLAANVLLRANYASYSDIIVDVAADARFSDYTNRTYFDGDQIHYTDAGYAAIADLIKASLVSSGVV